MKTLSILAAALIVLVEIGSLVHAGSVGAFELQGDGIVVHFSHKDNQVTGTIDRDGERFPFKATADENDTVTGKFTAGGDSYSFKITVTDTKKGTMVLETEGTRYTLKAVPIGKDPKPKAPPAPKDNPPKKDESETPDNPAPKAKEKLILEQQVIHDPKTQLEVATLLVPKKWTVDEQVLWEPNKAQFVSMTSRVADPSGQVALQWLPGEQFSADPVLAANARQQNAPPFTGGLELADGVPNAEEYLKKIAIPRHAQIKEGRVIRSDRMPEIARSIADASAAMVAAGKQMNREFRFDAARIRLEYANENGAAMEADYYCGLLISWDVAMNATRQQVGSPPAFIFYPTLLYSFSAPKGQLDAKTPLLQTIVGSMRTTVKWESFTSIIQGVRLRAVINDQIIANGIRAEITESQRQTWEASMKSQDKIAEGVGDAIKGVYRYAEPNDPDGNHVLLPAGYKGAWSDGQKHYILSEDGNYNPNQDGTLNGEWKEMKPPE